MEMRRMIGFALFFIAIGMLIAMLLADILVNSVIIVSCVVVSYNFIYRI